MSPFNFWIASGSDIVLPVVGSRVTSRMVKVLVEGVLSTAAICRDGWVTPLCGRKSYLSLVDFGLSWTVMARSGVLALMPSAIFALLEVDGREGVGRALRAVIIRMLCYVSLYNLFLHLNEILKAWAVWMPMLFVLMANLVIGLLGELWLMASLCWTLLGKSKLKLFIRMMNASRGGVPVMTIGRLVGLASGVRVANWVMRANWLFLWILLGELRVGKVWKCVAGVRALMGLVLIVIILLGRGGPVNATLGVVLVS